MALTVLIIDDDKLVRTKVSHMLSQRGFQTHHTDDWAEITKILAAETIDLILMDVEMPHLSGDRIAKVIFKTVQDPPLIYLHSSLEEDDLAERTAAIGANGFLRKGLSGDDYAARIESAVAKARASFDGGHLGVSKD